MAFGRYHNTMVFQCARAPRQIQPHCSKRRRSQGALWTSKEKHDHTVKICPAYSWWYPMFYCEAKVTLWAKLRRINIFPSPSLTHVHNNKLSLQALTPNKALADLQLDPSQSTYTPFNTCSPQIDSQLYAKD